MDRQVLEKDLVHLRETVDLLKARARPEALATDIAELYFVTYALQTAVQAALDAAAIIVSTRRLGEPRTNREVFRKLAQDGWITAADANTWQGLVSFRNVAVLRYLQVDPEVARSIVESHLDDLLHFVSQVRARLDELERSA